MKLFQAKRGGAVAGFETGTGVVMRAAPILKLAAVPLADAVTDLQSRGWLIQRVVPYSGQVVPWNQEGGAVHVRHEPFDVYIGRKGHGYDHRPEAGMFGNPVTRNTPCTVCGEEHTRRGSTLDCYEVWVKAAVQRDELFQQAVTSLHGLRLGCFCGAHKACHGHILHDLATELAAPAEDDDVLDSVLGVLAKVSIAT